VAAALRFHHRLRDGVPRRCQTSQVKHGQEGAKGCSGQREKPEERVVFGLLPCGVEERYPRRAGDTGGILGERSEGATFNELTKECLPFGDGPRGVKTQEGVWEGVRVHTGVTHAGRGRHNHQHGQPDAPDAPCTSVIALSHLHHLPPQH
jgi:hypothetical protein